MKRITIRITLFFVLNLLISQSLNLCLYAFEKVKFRSPSTGQMVDVVKGEILVVFKDGVSVSKKETLHRSIGVQKISDDTDGRIFQKIKIPEGKTIESVIQKYKADPDVRFAEPNYIKRKFVNDPLYTEFSTDTAKQWGLAKINIKQAWNITTGTPTVVVAVLDTGIDYNHPEFQGALTSSITWRAFISTTGVKDYEGHGTHVAGIIGARSNSIFGVGVTTTSLILPIKVLDDNGDGTTESMVNGIVYASTVTLPANQKVRVINLSLGGYEYSEIENFVIQEAFSKGICIVAAKGNDNTDKPSYPADFPNVLSVGAVNSLDIKANFSNYGTTLDLVAPGVDILSTVPLPKTTDYYDGTSMAAPFVSGVAALILSINPQLKPADVYKILTDTTDDLGVPGFDNFYGYGRLNAGRALSAAKDYVPQVVRKTFSYPNPFYLSKTQRIFFAIPDAIDDGQLPKVRIYNFAGDLLKSGTMRDWDGKDDNGNLVSTGLYFFAVETSKGKSTGKMTVIR